MLQQRTTPGTGVLGPMGAPWFKLEQDRCCPYPLWRRPTLDDTSARPRISLGRSALLRYWWRRKQRVQVNNLHHVPTDCTILTINFVCLYILIDWLFISFASCRSQLLPPLWFGGQSGYYAAPHSGLNLDLVSQIMLDMINVTMAQTVHSNKRFQILRNIQIHFYYQWWFWCLEFSPLFSRKRTTWMFKK